MLMLKRVDGATLQCKQSEAHIPLPVGIHPFGRGVLLACEDKRVSRQHGQLEVFKDSVILKAMSTNPCFLKKSGDETRVLKSGLNGLLRVGDRFGLLPNEYWYEVVDDSSSSADDQQGENGIAKSNDDTEPMDSAGCPNTSRLDGDIAASGADAAPNGSRRRLHADDEDASAAPTAVKLPRVAPMGGGATSSAAQPPDPPPADQNAVGLCGDVHVKPDPDAPHVARDPNSASGKVEAVPNNGNHSSSSPKVIAIGPRFSPECADAAGAVTVKRDPDACTSGAGVAAPPAQPAQPTRERCIYGAQCYRRHAKHKATFSHPADADWGGGERGVCPWGVACRRHDPRHWQHHTHPPGARPPPCVRQPHRGARNVVVRHGNTFYVDAHVVHFHDDRFVVEDEDGDRVDYDYEF